MIFIYLTFCNDFGRKVRPFFPKKAASISIDSKTRVIRSLQGQKLQFELDELSNYTIFVFLILFFIKMIVAVNEKYI